MKQYQINRAYPILNRIAGTQLPVRQSYAVYMLIKKLEPIYAFEIEHEQRLISKYNGIIKEDGTVVISDKSKLDGFKKEIEELGNIEIDIQLSSIILPCESLYEIRLSPYEIGCLEGFIEFE